MVLFLNYVTWCWPQYYVANLICFCHLLVKRTDCPVLTMITDTLHLQVPEQLSFKQNRRSFWWGYTVTKNDRVVFGSDLQTYILNITYRRSCCSKDLSSHNVCQLEERWPRPLTSDLTVVAPSRKSTEMNRFYGYNAEEKCVVCFEYFVMQMLHCMYDSWQ